MPQKVLPKELLQILACPVCKTKLNHNRAKMTLTCSQCKAVYPVKEGIPILLPRSK